MNRIAAIALFLTLTTASIASAATLTLSPDVRTVEGNVALQGVVMLDGAAPVSLNVTLSSNNPAAASVPASVAIKAGTNRGTFAIDVNSVTADTMVTIRASASSIDRSVSFIVLAPARLTGVTVNPTRLVGGQSGKASASINRPAGHGGVKLDFGSSKLDVATVPATGTVAPGSSAATVSVTTKVDGGVSTIHSTLAGFNLGARLDVDPAPLEMTGITVESPIASGTQRFGRITFNRNASENTPVAISTTHPNVKIGETSTVVAGQAKSSFTVAVNGVAPGTPPSTAEIKATLGSTTKTVTFTVEPLQIVLTGLTSSIVFITEKPQDMRVSLNVTAPNDVEVALASDNASVPVPKSVIIPAGQAGVTFPVAAKGLQPGAPNGTAAISANLGSVTKKLGFNVHPPRAAVASLSVPSPIQGGTPQTAQVTLVEASLQNETVALTSTFGSIAMPTSFTIPAGQPSATFTVASTMPEGAASQNATIAANIGGVQKTVTVVVNSPVPAVTIASFSVNPQSVMAGGSTTGTVTLSTAAPGSGQAVFFSEASSFVEVPSSVTVPGGQTTGTVPITVGRPVNASGAPAETVSVSIAARIGAQPSVPASFLVSSPRLERVVFAPATVEVGSRSASGRVELNAPAPEGGARVVLTCQSSEPSVPCDGRWSSPPSNEIFIAAGQRSGDFSTNVPDPAPTQPQTSTWSFSATSADLPATTGGALTLKHLLPTVTLSSPRVRAGEQVTGTVRLSDPTANGVTVALFAFPSDRCQSQTGVNTSSWLPASVSIPPGQQSVTFTVATEPPSCDVDLRVEGMVQAVSASAIVSVTSARVVSITASPSTVVAGQPFSLTITLDNTVPFGGGMRGITLNKIDPESILGIQTGMIAVPTGQTTLTITGQTRAGAATETKTVTFGASRPPDQQDEVRTTLTVNPQ